MSKSINIELLQATKHMFEWFAKKPFEAMVNNIENILTQQVSDAQIKYFEATSDPQWLSGGTRDKNDENKVTLVRAGVAFEFKLIVEGGGTTEELQGVYSWVKKKEAEAFAARTWFDINGTLTEFGSEGALLERIH